MPSGFGPRTNSIGPPGPRRSSKRLSLPARARRSRPIRRGNMSRHGANILVALFGEKDSHAVHFLTQRNITRLDVVNQITQAADKSLLGAPAKPQNEAETEQ